MEISHEDSDVRLAACVGHSAEWFYLVHHDLRVGRDYDSLEPHEQTEIAQDARLVIYGALPETVHHERCKRMLAQGWTVGPLWDPEYRITPLLVPYRKLPTEYMKAVDLFVDTVKAVWKACRSPSESLRTHSEPQIVPPASFRVHNSVYYSTKSAPFTLQLRVVVDGKPRFHEICRLSRFEVNDGRIVLYRDTKDFQIPHFFFEPFRLVRAGVVRVDDGRGRVFEFSKISRAREREHKTTEGDITQTESWTLYFDAGETEPLYSGEDEWVVYSGTIGQMEAVGSVRSFFREGQKAETLRGLRLAAHAAESYGLEPFTRGTPVPGRQFVRLAQRGSNTVLDFDQAFMLNAGPTRSDTHYEYDEVFLYFEGGTKSCRM